MSVGEDRYESFATAVEDQYFGALEVGFDGLGLDDVAENGYGEATHHDALYTYSTGAFSFAVSASSDNTDDSIAVGFQYEGPVTVALGYNDDGANKVTSLGVTGSMGDIAYNVAFVDNEADGQGYGVGLTYSVNGALKIMGGIADNDVNTDTSYGIGMSYALGGGATLAGGIASIDGTTKADLGVNMSF